ncbi:MAG: rhamnan synthesis F family protein [Sulfuricurvum sp.]
MFKKFRSSKLKQKISECGVFDSSFYLREYSDVRVYEGSALEHFIKIGLSENRKPSKKFDNQWYESYYLDIQNSRMNAIEHYIMYGYQENRFMNSLEFSIHKVLVESGLFDESYYLSKYIDLQKHKKTGFDLILHYIRYGANENRNPNQYFDTAWYREHYSDVHNSKMNPLFHYALYGCKERRSTNAQMLNNAEESIKTFEHQPNIELSAPIENSIYVDDYESSNEEMDDYEVGIYNSLVNANIDWSCYFDTNTHPACSSDPIIDYIKNWEIYKPIIPDFFDTKMYIEIYPDIIQHKINPLMHYIFHGKQEGRIGFIGNHIKNAKIDFKSDKETILFVSHESSATGAPLLGYNIVESLNKKYNVFHLVLKKANLHEVFFDNCCMLIDEMEENPEIKALYILKELHQTYNIKCVVLNSVETFPVLHVASSLLIPTVSLIHEFADYTRPVGKMVSTLFHADEVIVPATIIENSILEELKQLTGITDNISSISKFPQGKLPFLPDSYGDDDTPEQLLGKFGIKDKNNTKIIVASGYVQIRKGVDLFIYIARYIKQKYEGKCKFVWVGDGYNPEYDMAYSAWLKREIKYLGLQNDVFFLEHQKNLNSIFAISDLFCLTSRMDPFPNVVIDALEHNLPIACFRDASGSVEFLEKHNADCLISDFLDTYDMAQKIVDYFYVKDNNKETNKQLVIRELDFAKYVDSLDNVIQRAYDTKQKIINEAETIEKSNIFDVEYYGLTKDKKLALHYYISLFKKNLHKMNPNPLPGFNQAKWIMEHPANSGLTPLLQAIQNGNYKTHECKLIPQDGDSKKTIAYTYAIHLHLYYIDLADEFIEYFKYLPGNYDLFVTIVKEDEKSNVEEIFKNCGANKIFVVVVENIGRDVAPMLFSIGEQIISNKYEVIGHFHSKKSISTDGDLGNAWRTYLLQNLIGNDEIASSQILNLFNDPKVGLVFAEDKHIVDLGDNKEYIDSLCRMLGINKNITNTPLIPLGNMFWARIDAIKDLFNLDPNKLLQPEPLPYDGSYMHALERITPNLIEKNGYFFATVYKRGTKW